MIMKPVADFENQGALRETHKFPQFVLPRYVSIIILSITICFQESESSVSKFATLPPIPLLPIPTSRQISWQLTEMAMFFHFGPNTFTDSEWGTGHVDPSVFNPTSLNATQWVSVAKDSGFSRVILTVKHHDGFCLWPSEYTDYSVKSSSWKNGTGDVVKELADAARIAGLELGFYLSPWDRHEPCYGKSLEYNEYYMGQMTELLTWYGEIKEIWLDGAKDEGEKDMEYFFSTWFSLIHQLQPETIIFSDDGPDSRWIGDEDGAARTTCWSLLNHTTIKIGQADTQDYLGEGDPEGPDWIPAECDVSIRSGWFWHASQAPKSALALLDIYYTSVGRNCLFLLNVPPNSSGLISPEDIQVLQEFAEIRSSIFSHNLAKSSLVRASNTRGGVSCPTYGAQRVLEDGIFSYWAPDKAKSDWALFFEFQEEVTFNVLLIQEPIHMGQRVVEFHLDFVNEKGEWEEVTRGTTVGYKRLLLFPSVTCRHLKLEIVRSRSDPLISYVGLYVDRFSVVRHVSLPSSRSRFNGSASF
ncbi:alpha-L-fucosidase 1 [Henckelia pumila]|uniref:alpha-L-fucosidase 1 n=1 Tax=Henckelia pumila TaxID=405737 RepID=UPI003C6DD9F4